MKIFKWFVFLLFLFTVTFVMYTVYSVGQFRSLDNPYKGDVLMKFNIPGAEDMEYIDEEFFLVVSSDDRKSIIEGENVQGGIYVKDVRKIKSGLTKISEGFKKDFHPHGISLTKSDSSGYILFVVNHFSKDGKKEHSIEKFHLDGYSLNHLETIQHPSIKSPNDIVALDADRFYFTNDHGSNTEMGLFLEDYLGLSRSNVVFHNGKDFQEVANGIAYANGINFDPNRQLLYVASVRGFCVNVYSVLANNELDFIESIDCKTGVDNIELDDSGALWIGCHPSLLSFSTYAAGKQEIAPSEVIKVEYRGKGDFVVESLFVDDGAKISGASVAIPIEGDIYVGNVMDDKFVVLSETVMSQRKK